VPIASKAAETLLEQARKYCCKAYGKETRCQSRRGFIQNSITGLYAKYSKDSLCEDYSHPSS